MIQATNILQAIALYMLWGEISAFVWWSMAAVYIVLFIGVRSYYNTTPDDGAAIIRFWFQVRSAIFLFNILSIILLFGYIMLF